MKSTESRITAFKGDKRKELPTQNRILYLSSLPMKAKKERERDSYLRENKENPFPADLL